MAQFIERAIRSALNQTYDDIEVVVTDNCSTDGTYEIASAMRDSRLRVFRNDRNLGAYGNHNRCLELARGEWVKFLHGDDELLSSCIDEMARGVMSLPGDAALIGCGAIRHDEEGRETEKTVVPDGLLVMRPASPQEFVLYGNVFGTPTMTLVHRNRALEVGGFDLDMEPAADGDCWMKLRCAYASGCLPAHLVIIRDDPPGGVVEQERSSVKWCEHTFKQVEKWHQTDELLRSLPLRQTIYGDWLVRETFRHWDGAARFVLRGRIGLMGRLWCELGRRGLRGKSLRYYVARRLRGRNAKHLENQPWPVILLKLQPAAESP